MSSTGEQENLGKWTDPKSPGLIGNYSDPDVGTPSLKSAFELFLGTFDQAAVGILHILNDGRISIQNQCARRILGYSLEGLTQQYFQDLLHPEDKRLAIEQQALLDAQKIDRFSLECRIRHRDGHLVWNHVTVAQQRDVEGCPSHLIVTLQDISERKIAEEKYRKAKQELHINLAQLEAIIGHLPQGVLIYDSFGELHRANPAAVKMGAQHLLLPAANPAASQLIMRDGEGEELQPGAWPLERALQGLPVDDLIYESSEKSKPHVSLWHCINAVAVHSKDGELLLIIVTVHDISVQKRVELALRESERGYRQLADSMPHIVWVTDAEGQPNFFNKRWYEFTAVRDINECNFDLWINLVHPEDLRLIDQRFKACLKTGETLEIEIRIKNRLTASYEWYLVKSAPARNSEGEITHWYGTSTSIQHQKMVEDKLRRADRAKDEFFAVLSHELRSPLNVILGYTDLLKRSKLSHVSMSEAIESIERNAKAQAQLVGDLLDVSTIIGGHFNVVKERFDPSGLLQDAIESVKFAAAAKNVELDFHLDRSVKYLDGDANRIRQILWNLLSNAIKFTPENGQVSLHVAAVGEWYEMRVRDSGIRLSAESLLHVFDRFWQENAISSQKQFGLGLGLSIVRHLTEAHGGKVWAESEGQGKGSVFIVRLPLSTKHMLETPPAPRSQVQVATEMPQGKELNGRKILVVDDQEDSTRLAMRILTGVGAEVQCALSGAEALRFLKEQSFDLVISDIAMPEMDGLDLMRSLRSWEAEKQRVPIPAIALATYAGEFSYLEANEVGFQRHFVKPISPKVLINEVLKVLCETSGQVRPTSLAAIERFF